MDGLCPGGDAIALRTVLSGLDASAETLREGFLLTHSANTARGYNADLEHLEQWLHSQGRSTLGLSNALLFRYLRTLQAAGYRPSTVRRRLTCLRAFVTYAAGHNLRLQVDVDAVAERLRGYQTGMPATSGVSMIVISDDVLVRHGMCDCTISAGFVDCVDVSFGDVEMAIDRLPRFDYALLHLTPRRTPDRWRVASLVSLVSQGKLAVTTLAIASVPVPSLVRLRLAEAGCDFLLPYGRVAMQPLDFVNALGAGNLEDRYRLPTQWAIRESLGLRWNGALEPYIQIALGLPAELWTTNLPKAKLPADSAQLREVQRQARDIAGLPEPDFRRYATALRRPPQLPEWARVRTFTRGLLGIPARP